MMYLYCNDKKIKDDLLQKGLKLITLNRNPDIYVFEYKPEQYSLDFSNSEISKACTLSNKLTMTF